MSDENSFDAAIGKLKIAFKLAGLMIESKKATKEEKFKSRLVYFILLFWLNTDVIGEILWIVDGIVTGKSFTEITSIVPCNIICLLSDCKAFFHVINEDKISDLIDNIRNINIDTNISDQNEQLEKNEIVKKEVLFLKFVRKCLRIMNISPVIMFALFPLILMAIHYYKTGEIFYILPFLAVYPFDPYYIAYWPFVYFHQMYSVISQVAATDSLLYTCCIYINMHFKVLHYDIEHLITDANKYDFDVLNDKIEQIVIRHQRLTRLVTLQEEIYSKSMLFNFITSSGIICLTGFNASAIDDIVVAISYSSFLVMALLQVFLLCFFGNMISESSMEVSSAVYNSQWYSTKASVAKKLFYIQLRGFRPSKLTAYGFIDVNLIAFTKVLSTSWSYFALLQSVYGR